MKLTTKIRMVKYIAFVLMSIVVVGFTACGGTNEVLSHEEFTSRMEAEGNMVGDFTHMLQDPAIERLLIADAGVFEVEFIVLQSQSYARSLYSYFRQNFESTRGSRSSHTETSGADFSRFRLTSEGSFVALTRIEHTIVIASSSVENRDDVLAVFDLLGY